ncbi:MAG: hypothetical protein ACRYHQ_20265 [Janthinobacterium lividum]
MPFDSPMSGWQADWPPCVADAIGSTPWKPARPVIGSLSIVVNWAIASLIQQA